MSTTIIAHELEELEQASATGRTPVVFIHGLWLLPSSWDRWAAVFDEGGYARRSAACCRCRSRRCGRRPSRSRTPPTAIARCR